MKLSNVFRSLTGVSLMTLASVILLCIGGSPSAWSAPETPAIAAEKRIIDKCSLEELNSAATYLMAVFEASLDGKKTKILACDPEPQLAETMLSGPLHSLIDQKAEKEAALFKKNLARELKKVQKKWAACADTCQCNAYLAITELIESKDKTFTEMTAKLKEDNRKQSAASSASCAAKQEWFCKSALESYLKDNSQN